MPRASSGPKSQRNSDLWPFNQLPYTPRRNQKQGNKERQNPLLRSRKSTSRAIAEVAHTRAPKRARPRSKASRFRGLSDGRLGRLDSTSIITSMYLIGTVSTGFKNLTANFSKIKESPRPSQLDFAHGNHWHGMCVMRPHCNTFSVRRHSSWPQASWHFLAS